MVPGKADGPARKRYVELLAPAGSFEALEAALHAGADAVYLGTREFGARRFAENFTLERIDEALELAHSRGASIHVTMNTLIHPERMHTAVKLGKELWNAGVDALIVQDPGLMHRLSREVEGIELHASTQATIHNMEGVRTVAALGASRAILARETPLEQIRYLSSNGPIDIEVFVHGALCYSYSGQCLFSGAISARPANQGACTQPCRRPYKLRDPRSEPFRPMEGGGRYLLSTRDLCLVEHLGELVDAGVVSVKIEGRMKSPDYVGTVTSIYRKYLDRVLAGKDATVEQGDMDSLRLAYNRGFTGGYGFGDAYGSFISSDRPDNHGLPVGRVEHVDARRKRMDVRLVEGKTIRPGQILKLVSGPDYRAHNTNINASKIEKKGPHLVELNSPREVPVGAEVFATPPPHRSWRSHVDPCPSRWPAVIHLVTGSPPSISVTVGNDMVVVAGDMALEASRTSPAGVDTVTDSLARVGNAPVALGPVTAVIEGEPFVRASVLNDLRRKSQDAVARHLGELGRRPGGLGTLLHGSRTPGEVMQLPRPYMDRGLRTSSVILVTSGTEDIRKLRPSGCDIYLDMLYGLKDDGKVLDHLLKAARKLSGRGNRIFAKLPRITYDPYLNALEKNVDILRDTAISGIVVGNPGALALLRGLLPESPIIASSSFNVFNREAAEVTRQLGADSAMLSMEAPPSQWLDIASAGGIAKEVLVWGRPTLMVTQDCIPSTASGARDHDDTSRYTEGLWHLRDTKKRKFTFRVDGDGRTHIYHHTPIDLTGELPRLVEGGITRHIVDLRGLPDEELDGAARAIGRLKEASGAPDRGTG